MLAERPGYFPVHGADLYTVLHQVENLSRVFFWWILRFGASHFLPAMASVGALFGGQAN